MLTVQQSAELLSPLGLHNTVAAIKLVECAARNCYNSTDNITNGSYWEFIPKLIKSGHDSPLEFCDITLQLTTSRDVMAELTRHRLASFAIQSQRYVGANNTNGDITFIRPEFYLMETQNIPESIPEKSMWWASACAQSEDSYKEAIRLGMQKQDARKCLNNSVATIIVMKMNARELRHMLGLRLSPAAYPEMRRLANLILEAVKEIPVLFDDIDFTIEDFKEKRANI